MYIDKDTVIDLAIYSPFFAAIRALSMMVMKNGGTTHIYIDIHTYKYVHTYILTCTNTHTHAHIHTYIPTYTNTHIFIHIYIHTDTCTHTYMHTYIYAYIQTCMHAYIHTYIHTCIHTCIHTYIHKHGLSGKFPNVQIARHCVDLEGRGKCYSPVMSLTNCVAKTALPYLA